MTSARSSSLLLIGPLLCLALACEISPERKSPSGQGSCQADADCPSGYSCMTSADDQRFCAKSGGGDTVIGEDAGAADIVEGDGIVTADVGADAPLEATDIGDPDDEGDAGPPDVETETTDAEVTDPIDPKPSLVATPELVDFGFVAQGHASTRELTLGNQGAAELEISSIVFDDDAGGEFTVETDPTPATLAPGESATVALSFTNDGAGQGSVSGALSILSNDPVTPSTAVVLQAQRAGAPECELVFVPSQLDFGVVPFGQDMIQTMGIKNIGSGDCTFKSARVVDCSGLPGMGATCNIATPTPSVYFEILGFPPSVQDGLPSGALENIAIRFTPSETENLFGFNEHPALLVVTYEESYSAGGQPTEHTLPTSGADAVAPNINGQGGTSQLAALPTQLDFGPVTVGCYSASQTISLYNLGDAALQISSVYLVPDCPSVVEFKLSSLPPLPLQVSSLEAASIELRYLPQDLGPDTCALAVETSDPGQPALIIPLAGEGTFETQQTDSFVQGAASAVDVLFVVDSSGSMSPVKEALASSIGALSTVADSWDADYQIGVMGLGVEEGCDNTGTLQGEPPILHNTTAGFSERVLVVDQGGCAPDAQEAGLEAIYRALSWPLIYDVDQPCGADVDCAPPYLCVDGGCGGPNRGFLRDDAALEIVVISDEEDQSPGPVDFYVDFLHSLKGAGSPDRMHFHAIVGDPDSDGCVSADGNLQAGAGHRYVEVQEATGGVFTSICAGDVTAALASIGVVAFGLQTSFALSRDADPATIQVTVAGSPCGGGWSYDAEVNAVVLDPLGDCLPAEGDAISIFYEVLCAAP
jgi:hypothetical protein